MRIAIFSEVWWPMVSGVSLVLQRLATALTARGHEVRIYAPAYDLPAGVPDQPSVFRVPSRRFFLYRDVRWGFPVWPTISADFARFQPDVVHVATEFAMGMTGLRLAREHGVPVVASAHTDYERYASRYGVEWLMGAGWRYLRWFYGQAEQVLCPSEEYRRHLGKRGVPHTGIWTRGLDRQLFSPDRRQESVRAALGVAPEERMVLYVGRLAAEKNLPLLLAAWRELPDTVRQGARLVIVGQGPLEEALRADAPADVTLAGVRTGVALAEVYAAADCFVFPSSTETFGNVLLEAMGSGVASLAVRAGGVLDFARHGENAWLVAPDSVPALCEGMTRLIQDAPLRRALAAGGLATAAARDWDRIFDGLEAVYQRVGHRPSLRLSA